MDLKGRQDTLVSSVVSVCDSFAVLGKTDQYEHVLPHVIYTPTNIPGPGASEEFHFAFVVGCTCEQDKCNTESGCACLCTFGPNYSDEHLLLESKLNGPIFECNLQCKCSQNASCKNRVVQCGPLDCLTVFQTENRGYGLKTEKNIHKGTFICEYAGEVIGLEEARLRSASQHPNLMNYIFILKEHLSTGEVLRTCVDPTAIGNVGRYINHSCEPNSFIVPVRINSFSPNLAIFASREIKAGEEITFHYGGGSKIEDMKSDEKSQLKPCLCNSKCCRQFLPFDSDLF